MATPERPNDRPGGQNTGLDAEGRELERRKRLLDQELSSRRPAAPEVGRQTPTGGAAGFGQALKLSSEFVAGVAVGAGIGWAIDRFAGTSPWGLIVFLLLGFVAGVLNVMRSAGLMAQPGARVPGQGTDKSSNRASRRGED